VTTYYVRSTGSDAAAGTSAAAAWLTIGKALGATGIASGDTVYIGAGTYREVVTVAMTSAVAETFVIGDVDGSHTGDAGEVIWTAYTTSDVVAPSTSSTLDLAGVDFLTFQRLTFVSGTGSLSRCILANTVTSTNIKIQDCNLLGHPGSSGVVLEIQVGFAIAANWVMERTIFRCGRGNGVSITLVTGSGADYDANLIIRNCVIEQPGGAAGIIAGSSGSSAQEGGGVYIYNCLILGTANSTNGAVQTSGTRVGGSTFAFPVRVLNSVVRGGLSAGELGAIVENYNHISASTPLTNVTQGANTVLGTAYSMLFSYGRERYVGTWPRPYGEPMAGSPYLGFGNDGTYTSSEDIRGNPRPAGGATATKGIGAYERANTFSKETGTTRTGANAISITGPGYQDFQLPVVASSTTTTIYVRWDATYAGTKPKMQVLNGTEAGVADATATATGSSGAWEQLSLNFTPTSAGIVTIRLLSSDTNGGGKMFADDFAVA
jgi:hypothetical protein